MSTLAQIANFLRWREWGPGKLSLLWGLSIYIALAYELAFEKYLITFLVFLPFAAAQAALGHVVNEWSDRELDRRQFKRNAFNGMTQLECILSISLVLVAAIITGLPFIPRPGVMMLWLVWAVLMAAYSLEPLRLKTKGLVGLLVLLAAQWFLPVLITFAVFEAPAGVEMWVLAAAITVSGASLEISRQQANRTRQMITGTGTFVAGISDADMDQLKIIFHILDKLAIGLVIAVAVSTLENSSGSWFLMLSAILALPYALLVLVTLRNMVRRKESVAVSEKHLVEDDTSTALLHEAFVVFAMPVVAGTALAIQIPVYGFVVGVFVVYQLLAHRPNLYRPLAGILIRISK